MKHTLITFKLPVGTDMTKVRDSLKRVKKNRKDGKTANALIAEYILKLAK